MEATLIFSHIPSQEALEWRGRLPQAGMAEAFHISSDILERGPSYTLSPPGFLEF